MDLKEKIKKLKKEKNALILAHNYQLMEVQEVADFTGDSLELARISARTEAEVIVFCGVYFMAELAKILNPEKKVLIPDKGARCPLADMATPADVERLKARYPDALVCSYVNSNADVKALSDIICTSANAIKVVESLSSEKVIFLPDENLGSWVQRHTRKEIILHHGFCYVHRDFDPDWIKDFLSKHPDYLFLAHPECRREVVDLADEVLSTSGMVKFVEKSDSKKFLIATEEGLVQKLKKLFPEKEFRVAGEKAICEDMKKITLEKVYQALEKEIYEVKRPEEIMERSRIPLQRMLQVS